MVPGMWESIPKLRRYQGRAVYETQFEAGGHVRLSLGGVSFRARVLLDSQELCTHYGAYAAFEAVAEDIPDGLHTLRVDESLAMSRPRTHNNKGVVDEYRRPKLAYKLVKKVFHRE